MGGAIISVEAQTEQEAKKQLDQLKKKAKELGLLDERTRFIGYDDKDKVWRGYSWLHS